MSYIIRNTSEDHGVRHGGLAVEQSIGLGEPNLDIGTKHQLVVVSLNILNTSFAAESLGDLTAEPDGLVGFDAFGAEFHQELWWLVVVDCRPAAHHVAKAVHRVDLTEGIGGTRVRYQADLVVDIEVRLDVLLVKLGSGDRSHTLVVLRLIIILPGERFWWYSQADTHYPIDYSHLLEDSLVDLRANEKTEK